MPALALTYQGADTRASSIDPRVKLALMVVFSATLFLVETPLGLMLEALLFLGVLAGSGVPPRHVFRVGAFVYMLAAIAFLGNVLPVAMDLLGGSASSEGRTVAEYASAMQPSQGAVAGSAPMLFCEGSGALDPVGFILHPFAPGFGIGLLVAMRILLLAWASILLTATTASESLTAALRSFISPLRPLRVPVDDIAMTLSLALRFIPLISREFARLHASAWSRGAHFADGGILQRAFAWGPVFVALFVGLFRQADRTATALDVRCYGMPGKTRTALVEMRMNALSAAVLVAFVAACACLAIFC